MPTMNESLRWFSVFMRPKGNFPFFKRTGEGLYLNLMVRTLKMLDYACIYLKMLESGWFFLYLTWMCLLSVAFSCFCSLLSVTMRSQNRVLRARMTCYSQNITDSIGHTTKWRGLFRMMKAYTDYSRNEEDYHGHVPDYSGIHRIDIGQNRTGTEKTAFIFSFRAYSARSIKNVAKGYGALLHKQSCPLHTDLTFFLHEVDISFLHGFDKILHGLYTRFTSIWQNLTRIVHALYINLTKLYTELSLPLHQFDKTLHELYSIFAVFRLFFRHIAVFW